MCDFAGCDRPDLQPVQTHGWVNFNKIFHHFLYFTRYMRIFLIWIDQFWTAELQKIAPTTDRSQGDWSPQGGIGLPQPDDREYKQGGAHENCLALLNQFYNDGVNWHGK